MKKKDILKAVKDELFESRSTDLSLKDIKSVLEIYFEFLLEDSVHCGEQFKTPIGTFFKKELKPRKGKTPEGKDFSVGERTKLSFRQNKQSKAWIELKKLNVTF
jgi:nucleoid DNA-binding protein